MVAPHGVRLDVNAARVEQGQSVRVQIENHSQRSVAFGEPWSIQRKVRGRWIKASFSPKGAWFEPEYFIGPHSASGWQATRVPIDAAAGVYRAVKELEIGKATKFLTAEFRVVPRGVRS